MCSKFRTVSAIFTDIWCIQEPQVAKCWYSNIEQRKWCRTTEIWGIGVNENVRHIFGPDNVRYIQEVLDDLNSTLWISDSRYRFLDSMFPDSGGFLDLNSQRFWIPLDLPVSGIWIPYLIRSEISLPTWGEVVFHASPTYISSLSTHSLLSRELINRSQ